MVAAPTLPVQHVGHGAQQQARFQHANVASSSMASAEVVNPVADRPQPEPDGTTRLCKFNLDSSLEVCTNLLTSLP